MTIEKVLFVFVKKHPPKYPIYNYFQTNFKRTSLISCSELRFFLELLQESYYIFSRINYLVLQGNEWVR